MKKAVLLVALALAACKAQAPVAEPSASASTGVAAPAAPIPADAPVVLAFGDSLYAGYQLPPEDSYPARLEAALNAKGVAARFVNAGVSGDTSAAARQRLAFTLDNQPARPALVMVGLGGNDMLRGLSVEDFAANLDAICAELKRRGQPFMLTGLRAPPNMGADYAAKFDAIYPALAKKYAVPLVPFLLAPVYDKPELQLPDRLHPNAAGVARIVAASEAQVAAALEAAVKEKSAR